MPRIGLGTYRITDSEARKATEWALEAGYRHIDTASVYKNEEGVGRAISNSGIPRPEVFVTTKAYVSELFDVKTALNRSLDRLKLDYVDLYLIHFPIPRSRDLAWSTMAGFLQDGRVRAIGVSNYTQRHLDQLLTSSGITPAVNQVEFSPFLYQKQLLEYCQNKGITVEAYAPLTEGFFLGDKTVVGVREKYGKSSAQILIRWALQHNLVVIPGSKSREHIKQNADVFDFEIGEEDMKTLDSLNQNFRTCWDPTLIS